MEIQEIRIEEMPAEEFKDLRNFILERGSDEIEPQEKDYIINHFGFGMLSNIEEQISEQMEIAALTISLVYLKRMEMISHSMTMSKSYLTL